MEFEDIQRIIKEEGDFVTRLLQQKNAKYGNSAIQPKRFFSKADSLEQIKVRIDDKLNRLTNGLSGEDEEDVVLDLIGYFILLRVAQRVQALESNLEYDQKNPLEFNRGGLAIPCECEAVNLGYKHFKGPGCIS